MGIEKIKTGGAFAIILFALSANCAFADKWDFICNNYLDADASSRFYCTDDKAVTVASIRSNCNVYDYALDISVVGYSKSQIYGIDYKCDGFVFCPEAEFGAPGGNEATNVYVISNNVVGGWCHAQLKSPYSGGACGELRYGYFSEAESVYTKIAYETSCTGAAQCDPGYFLNENNCYVCGQGMYKEYKNAVSICSFCPFVIDRQIATTSDIMSPQFHDSVNDCFAPAEKSVSNSTGTYVFTDSCYYSN